MAIMGVQPTLPFLLVKPKTARPKDHIKGNSEENAGGAGFGSLACARKHLFRPVPGKRGFNNSIHENLKIAKVGRQLENMVSKSQQRLG